VRLTLPRAPPRTAADDDAAAEEDAKFVWRPHLML
jgi:hypothetical protein